MKENLTELVFILDKSGSMCGMEADTIGGFNAMLAKQKKAEGEAYVSTILFSDGSTVVHDRIEIGKVPAMTEKDYTVSGCTALLDALGDAMHHIGSIHRYAREEDVPGHTVFVITTDGMENASRRYSAEAVKKEIEKRKKENGWEFLFLAANIDAVGTAARFGIDADRAVNYCCDSAGTAAVYSAVGSAIGAVRGNMKLSPQWSEAVAADNARRKK